MSMDLPMHKHKKLMGRAAALTTADKQEIVVMAAAGLSNREMGRRTGKAPRTIKKALSDPEMQKLKTLVLDLLWNHAAEFGEDLKRASRAAAERGRGEPALAVLQSLRILEPIEKGPSTGIVIQLGSPLPGLPGWKPDQDAATPVMLDVAPAKITEE
jgi:hypothetical protein